MIYIYWCDKCDKEFEECVSVENRNNVVCGCGTLAQKMISQLGMAVDQTMKDEAGTPIYFPKDGAVNYDRALQKTFYSKKQKQKYLKENKLVMDGSNDLIRKPLESGDYRFEKIR